MCFADAFHWFWYSLIGDTHHPLRPRQRGAIFVFQRFARKTKNKKHLRNSNGYCANWKCKLFFDKLGYYYYKLSPGFFFCEVCNEFIGIATVGFLKHLGDFAGGGNLSFKSDVQF